MYKEKLGIPDNHTLEKTGSISEQRKGRDTDIYNYDERDKAGDVIARYIVRDSMSIYPPQDSTVSYVKYDLEGKEIESGTI